jgi:hypothetical protein
MQYYPANIYEPGICKIPRRPKPSTSSSRLRETPRKYTLTQWFPTFHNNETRGLHQSPPQHTLHLRPNPAQPHHSLARSMAKLAFVFANNAHLPCRCHSPRTKLPRAELLQDKTSRAYVPRPCRRVRGSSWCQSTSKALAWMAEMHDMELL